MPGTADGSAPEALLVAAHARGLTIGVAESLTGGQVCDSLVAVPGASRTLRGGVVAYATDVKRSVLGVDGDLLAEVGPVHAEVARQMATGAARVLGASLGLATTGVAGPGPQDGVTAGTVVVAAVLADGRHVVHEHRCEGGRAAVRVAAGSAVIAAALELLDQTR